jgi:hypothetical protein
MCARKVQRVSSYSLDCELFVGLRNLKVGMLVALVRSSDGATASCNVVDTPGLNPGENMKTVELVLLGFYAVLLFFFFCRAQWLMPPDVLQPVLLIILTLLLDVPTFTASSLSCPHPASDPGSQSRNYAGEKMAD